VDRFQSWSECWKSSGFTVAFRRLLDEQDVLARILSRPGGERSITNVLHLGEMLQQAAVDARRGPLALIEWLQRMRHDEIARAEDVGDAAQIRLESDTQALKLITVHKSKGLQYPVVVCPFLWDAMLVHPDDKRYVRWHDPERDYRLSLDLGSERVAAHRALCKREALAEHLRLLYVALTRAEHLCLVAWGPFAGCEQSALGYLIHQDANVPEDELVDATRQRIESLSEEAMRADVERLAAASDAAIEVTELSADQPVAFAAAVEAGDDLRLRTMPRPVRQPWRLASFSALAAVESPLSEPVEEGVDRDEIAEQVATTLDEPAGTAVRGFPRGRRLGNLVHKLFETIDFTAIAPTALREQAQHLLPGYGIEAQWGDAICDAIGDVLDTPLDDQTPPLTLRRVPNARRLNELEFVFPVALAGAGGGLLAAHLADVFATHGAPWLTAYPARVRRLPFPQLAGYLKGFIDLVFAHGDRWFIVDYKTNDLGGRPADYRAARLLPEMQRHHYVLQYHLYSVALHRYLERRLTGYDYARHFGGVLYLFVRGMAPSHERGCGVFFDRPAAALVESLSDTLARPPTAPSGRVS
jgi:exodeoxyribonuclease V beta subunit